MQRIGIFDVNIVDVNAPNKSHKCELYETNFSGVESIQTTANTTWLMEDNIHQIVLIECTNTHNIVESNMELKQAGWMIFELTEQ